MKVSFEEQAIEAIFREFDSSAKPGVAVGIALNGRPLYRRAFGVASMELPIALSASMRMRLGSITKQFTCLAYLLLCEEGLADIEDPLSKYLPELGRAYCNVTVKQLMSHTSGLRDACDMRLRFGGYGGARTSSAEILQSYRHIDDVNGPPDDTWIYNNGTYVILSNIIERITGKTLEHVLRERVFAPIGMFDTLLRTWDSDFVPNSARTHTAVSPDRYETSSWAVDFAGAGVMVSTIDDMLRWLAHMGSPKVGTAATWKAIRTPGLLKSGASTGYGLGVALTRYRGLETISHIGGWTGANAQVVKAPACGLDVVVMTNRSDAFAPLLVNKVLDACVTGLEPAQAMDKRAALTGNYLSQTTRRLVQFFLKDGQQMVAIDGHELPYVTGPDSVMRPTPVWRHIRRFIRVAEGGEVLRPAQLDDFGRTEDLSPIATADGPAPVRVCGAYRSDVTGTDAVIQDSEGGLVMQLNGRFGSTSYSLLHVGDNIWRALPRGPGAGPIGAVVSFNEDQRVFVFSTAATHSLPFRLVG